MNNKLVVISEECWIYEAGRKAIVLAEEQGEYAMTEILFLDTMETVNKSFDWCGFKAIK